MHMSELSPFRVTALKTHPERQMLPGRRLVFTDPCRIAATFGFAESVFPFARITLA
jgi:hypothetical protein